jgi:hypothetical protein
MSKQTTCPACGQPTTVPAYPGDGAYITCGCPTGKRMAEGR